jgi:hypothetical protein
MKIFRPLTGIVALLSLAAIPPAHAGLIGSQVTYNNLFPDQTTVDFSVPRQTITSSTSIADTSFGGTDVFASTFTDTMIDVLFTGNATGELAPVPFNGWVYIFSGVNITGAVLDGGSSPDLSGAIVTFDASQIFVNLAGLNIANDDQFKIDVASTPVVVASPEPASMAIFTTGLIALGATCYRRRKAG